MAALQTIVVACTFLTGLLSILAALAIPNVIAAAVTSSCLVILGTGISFALTNALSQDVEKLTSVCSLTDWLQSGETDNDDDDDVENQIRSSFGGDASATTSLSTPELQPLRRAIRKLKDDIKSIRPFLPASVCVRQHVHYVQQQDSSNSSVPTINYSPNTHTSGGNTSIGAPPLERKDTLNQSVTVFVKREGEEHGLKRRDSAVNLSKYLSSADTPLSPVSSQSAASTVPTNDFRYVLHTALGVIRRRVTILCVNIRNFAQVYGDENRSDEVSGVIGEVSRMLTLISQEHKGILEGFHGDQFIISFNALFHTATHAKKAGRCAMEIARRIHNDNSELFLSMGISSGYALIGNVGDYYCRRPCIVGPAYNQAVLLQRLTKYYFDIPPYVLRGTSTLSRSTSICSSMLEGSMTQDPVVDFTSSLPSKPLPPSAPLLPRSLDNRTKIFQILTTKNVATDVGHDVLTEAMDLVSLPGHPQKACPIYALLGNMEREPTCLEEEGIRENAKKNKKGGGKGDRHHQADVGQEWMYQLQEQDTKNPFCHLNEAFEQFTQGNLAKCRDAVQQHEAKFPKKHCTISPHFSSPTLPGGSKPYYAGGASPLPNKATNPFDNNTGEEVDIKFLGYESIQQALEGVGSDKAKALLYTKEFGPSFYTSVVSETPLHYKTETEQEAFPVMEQEASLMGSS